MLLLLLLVLPSLLTKLTGMVAAQVRSEKQPCQTMKENSRRGSRRERERGRGRDKRWGNSPARQIAQRVDLLSNPLNETHSGGERRGRSLVREVEGGRLRGLTPSGRLRGHVEEHTFTNGASAVRMSGSAKGMLTGK